jgi:hypothetical protein
MSCTKFFISSGCNDFSGDFSGSFIKSTEMWLHPHRDIASRNKDSSSKVFLPLRASVRSTVGGGWHVHDHIIIS